MTCTVCDKSTGVTQQQSGSPGGLDLALWAGMAATSGSAVAAGTAGSEGAVCSSGGAGSGTLVLPHLGTDQLCLGTLKERAMTGKLCSALLASEAERSERVQEAGECLGDEREGSSGDRELGRDHVWALSTADMN